MGMVTKLKRMDISLYTLAAILRSLQLAHKKQNTKLGALYVGAEPNKPDSPIKSCTYGSN